MIFRRISHRIALQFTLFVFVLFLVNGMLFLFADFRNGRRQTHERLERSAQFLLQTARRNSAASPFQIPPQLMERTRLVDSEGNALYTGGLLTGIPFKATPRYQDLIIQGVQYVILTMPVERTENPSGYIQLAEIERLQIEDIPLRVALYLLVSIGVSALTYVAGLSFARRSLRPAEEMVVRLEQFTQDASHELRTPLATMRSSLDLALKTGQHAEGIASAQEDITEIVALVERLLELARLDRFVMETWPMDLTALTEDTVERHRPLAADRGVTLKTVAAKGVEVQGDASLVRQVLVNLLANAIKFTPEGGSVTVVLTKRSLVVKDTGIGIAADALPHLFDRFYQADESRAKDGYGLGLALVKRITDLHGWDINVSSQPGKGSTFTVSFS